MLERRDFAHDYLIPYIAETEKLLRSALRELDPSAECRITPAVDLCFPHDVVRIAGGFPTGCIVEWQCNVPVIPIDTTVNIDLTSVFFLSDSAVDVFNAEQFEHVRAVIENDTVFQWNFHKGNHFISAVKRASDGAPGIFFHSNEKEFKYQYNGLMPVENNWYWSDVKIFHHGSRAIRLLVGDKVYLFRRLAKILEEFSAYRHASIAAMLLGDANRIVHEEHRFHYFMPNCQSVVIGCNLCDPYETVHVLSKAGGNIDVFEPAAGANNAIHLFDGRRKLIVPHGWGKTSRKKVDVTIDGMTYWVNGEGFAIEPKASLGRHPDLVLREFSQDPMNSESLYSQMRSHCPGRVVDSWLQQAWYNKDGIVQG